MTAPHVEMVIEAVQWLDQWANEDGYQPWQFLTYDELTEVARRLLAVRMRFGSVPERGVR